MTTSTHPLPDGLTVQALAGRWLHEGRALPLCATSEPDPGAFLGWLTSIVLPTGGEPAITFTLVAPFPVDAVLRCALDATGRPVYFYAASPSEVAATP